MSFQTETYSSGTAPIRSDTRRILLVKQLNAINAGGGGGGGTGLLYGTGSPEGVVTGNIGQHYWNTATQSDWVKNSGTGTNTGWVLLSGPG